MTASEEKFISEEIEVRRDSDSLKPISFVWQEQEHQIREVIAVWPDYGFSAGAPKRKSWRMRRHRTCYRVETVAGEVFDIYHDRGLKPGGGKWYLQAQVT